MLWEVLSVRNATLSSRAAKIHVINFFCGREWRDVGPLVGVDCECASKNGTAWKATIRWTRECQGRSQAGELHVFVLDIVNFRHGRHRQRIDTMARDFIDGDLGEGAHRS